MITCKIHRIPSMSTRLQDVKKIRDALVNEFGRTAIGLKDAVHAADGKDFEVYSEHYVNALRRLFPDNQMTVNGTVLNSLNYEEQNKKILRRNREFQIQSERSRMVELATKWKNSLPEIEQLYIDILISEELNG